MDSFSRFHTILRRLSGTAFTAKLGEFYRGETAVLRAIEAIEASGETAYPSFIAEYLRISRPSVTSALTSLERKGYLCRDTSHRDRRHIVVTPTEKGREALSATSAEVDLWCSMMLEAMGQERFFAFLSIVEEGLDIMDIKE